jgi:HAD superfamily phosphoserine phosphatase-like hydrolase
MKKIVVFDFDGTLSAKDTNYEFWKYALKHSPIAWLVLPFTIFGFVISKLNKRGVFWREISRLYISNRFLKKNKSKFIKNHSQNRFGWAKETVLAEKQKKNYVVCISASPDIFINELVKDMNFDMVLSSEMNKKKPYKIKFLCYAENKVVKLKENIREPFHIVRAYSDSKSDLPIMNLADEQVWINPKTGCRRSL